jgi:hypothetical protein
MLDHLDLQSLIGGRSGLIYRCREIDGSFKLYCHLAELTFPAYAAAVVPHAMKTPRFRIRDLRGDLDDKGRLFLVRRLIQEGLVAKL